MKTGFRRAGKPAFRKSGIALLLLSASALAGCATRPPEIRYDADVPPLPAVPAAETRGRFRFPGKIRPIPGRAKDAACWALADAGHHQVVLLDDAGAVVARIGAGDPNAGQTENLDAITAVVLGGTSLFGGRGIILGTLVGALIVGVFRNGLTLMGVSSVYQILVTGVLVILAVLTDQMSRKGVR